MGGTTARGRLQSVGVALGALILLLIAWRAQHAFQYERVRAPGGWVMLTAVVVLTAVVLVAARDRARTMPSLSRTLEWGTVALLCLLGAAFRLVHFYSVPEGMNHDAGWYGQYANEILRGTPYTPYIAAAWGRETLFMYVVAPFITLFGNTPEALQAASALWGFAALVPFYLLARAMLGPATALAALGFLAVSGWHGVFSRAGWRVVTVPPFEMIALLGAWLVGERGRLRDWVILGVGAAGSIYTYNAGRIVPVICAVYVAGVLIARRHEWSRMLRGALVGLIAFLLVGAPMLWYAATHFEEFQGRAAYLEQERAVHGYWGNVVAAAGMFNYRGNGNDFFINEPLLEPMAAAIFALGALVAVFRIRTRASRFLLIGLVLALVPGVLAVPNANRCITAMPFAYLLLALGLRELLQTMSAWTGERWRGVAIAGIGAVLIMVAAVESYSEFLGPQRRNILGYSPGATAAGLAMRRHTDRYKLLTVASWPENTLTYLAYDGHGSPFERQYVWGQSYRDIEPELSPFGAKGLLVLIENNDPGKDALQRLQERFPVHRIEPLRPLRVGDEPVGKLFFVDRHKPDEPVPSNAFDGLPGAGPAEFNEPMGVAFDTSGNLYVSERTSHRLQKFSGDGNYIRTWGREGEQPGEFREPRDLTADDRFLYVSDTWNQRIQVFTFDGEPVRQIKPEPGLVGPRGIYVRAGRLYVSDTGRNVVRVFDLSGALLFVAGEAGGESLGHLIEPADVVADAAGRIYVINSGNNRIEVFDSSGLPLSMMSISGWQGTGAKEAYLAIGPDDTLYLSDPESTRVRRFTTAGTELDPILIPRMDFPSGIDVRNDTVVVGSRRWNTLRGALLK